MRVLERNLSAAGYTVINIHYPSRAKSIERIAEEHLQPVVQSIIITDNTKIHFITHSMGGIIVRHFLATNPLAALGKVIMLAPPNTGSYLANWLSVLPLSENVFGPAIAQLQTHSTSFVNLLPIPHYSVHVIAGKYDGKVPIKNTALSNQAAVTLVPRTHPFIMNAPEVYSIIREQLK